MITGTIVMRLRLTADVTQSARATRTVTHPYAHTQNAITGEFNRGAATVALTALSGAIVEVVSSDNYYTVFSDGFRLAARLT